MRGKPSRKSSAIGSSAARFDAPLRSALGPERPLARLLHVPRVRLRAVPPYPRDVRGDALEQPGAPHVDVTARFVHLRAHQLEVVQRARGIDGE